MSFVLDASATLAFIFPDERDDAAVALAQRMRSTRVLAPPLWQWEVQNAIVAVERRGRITSDIATSLLNDVAELPVHIDASVGGHIELARRLNLSVYDALYLDLAFRKHVPLATRDLPLIAAAKRLGVELMAEVSPSA